MQEGTRQVQARVIQKVLVRAVQKVYEEVGNVHEEIP